MEIRETFRTGNFYLNDDSRSEEFGVSFKFRETVERSLFSIVCWKLSDVSVSTLFFFLYFLILTIFFSRGLIYTRVARTKVIFLPPPWHVFKWPLTEIRGSIRRNTRRVHDFDIKQTTLLLSISIFVTHARIADLFAFLRNILGRSLTDVGYPGLIRDRRNWLWCHGSVPTKEIWKFRKTCTFFAIYVLERRTLERILGRFLVPFVHWDRNFVWFIATWPFPELDESAPMRQNRTKNQVFFDCDRNRKKKPKQNANATKKNSDKDFNLLYNLNN